VRQHIPTAALTNERLTSSRSLRANARVETDPDDRTLSDMTEIIFEVREDEVDGGYTASALGVGIHTQGDTLDELRANVREAVDCYFDETMDAPKIIRLHFVRDEVLAR
jgi:predicted RNase H-like HicB family nuclease